MPRFTVELRANKNTRVLNWKIRHEDAGMHRKRDTLDDQLRRGFWHESEKLIEAIKQRLCLK